MKICMNCGKELPKNKSKFCSDDCFNVHYQKYRRNYMRKYMKEYFKDDDKKEKHSKLLKQYREKNKELIKFKIESGEWKSPKEYWKEYYQKNKKKIFENQKRYRERHRDKIKAYAREYYRKRKEILMNNKGEQNV